MSPTSSDGPFGGAAYAGSTAPTGPVSQVNPAPSGTSNGSATTLSRGAITSRTEPTQRVATAAAAPRDNSKARTVSRPTRPPTKPASASNAPRRRGPRRVRLAIARVDPWSIMKMSFLLSVAAGIAGVVLTAVLWMILSTMNVFTDIDGVLASLQTSTTNPFSIMDYVGFGRVVSLSIVIGVIDVILLTAVSTVLAFLYNICSALVGGVQVTLTDD